MSTNQSRINNSQSFIDYLMRKKQQEQQQGAWSERTGIPSIDETLRPSAFPQIRASDAQPIINPTLNSMSRVAEMPVTDTLQRNYSPETGDMPDIINTMPDNVSLREERARRVTPIINAAPQFQPGNFQQSVKPVDSKGQDLPEGFSGSPPPSQIIAAQNAQPPQAGVISRPPATAISKIFDATRADSPPAFSGSQQPRIAAQPATDERGVLIGDTGQPLPLPASMADTSHESRARITDPSQFLINRAIGSLTDQPTYGFDKNGLPRTEAKRGLMGRAGAFGKTIFKDVTEGRPLISSLLDAGHAAANPDIVEKRRLQEQQQQNFRDAAPALAIQREQAQIADLNQQVALRNAQTQRALHPPPPKSIYRADAQGRLIKITPGQNGEPDKTEVVVNTQKTHAPHTQWADGRLLVQNPATGTWDVATDKNGQEITDKLRTPTEVEIDNDTYTVSPNTAAEVRATGQRFKITGQNEAARFKIEQGEKRAQWNKTRQEILNANNQVDTDLATYQTDLDRELATAKDSPSPKAQEQAARNATSIREKMVRRGAEKKPDPGEFPETNYTPATMTVGRPAARTSASPGGKIYTRAQVQKYADLQFGGDYSKAEANVRAEGYEIQ